MHRCLAGARPQAAQAKHEIAETVERQNGRAQHEEEKSERPHDRKGRALAALQRQAFRRQFPEHDVKRGDDD
ncbi:hypothetical protein D3C87_1778160 [compost metagenome]